MPHVLNHKPPPLATASARWVDGQRFLATGGSGHAVAIDSDRETNTAPGPMELVLMGLCACSATDLVTVLGKARQAFSLLEVSASGQRAPEPPTVYTAIHLVYRVVGPPTLSRAVVERAVLLSHTKYCGVFLMLNKTAAMSHEILIETEAGSIPAEGGGS